MTDPATTDDDYPPELADVLAATWRERLGCQPPADWLAHATAAVDAHLARLLTHTRTRAAQRADQAAQTAHDELTRLRTRVRRQLAGAVGAGHLDIDLANGMLHAFGLPGLRRAYTVHIRVPFVVRVNADSDTDAYQAARDTLANALVPDGDEIEGAWDDVENDGADPAWPIRRSVPSASTPNQT